MTTVVLPEKSRNPIERKVGTLSDAACCVVVDQTWIECRAKDLVTKTVLHHAITIGRGLYVSAFWVQDYESMVWTGMVGPVLQFVAQMA